MRSISLLATLLTLAFFAAASPAIVQDKREPGSSVISPPPLFFCPDWLSLLLSPTPQFPYTGDAQPHHDW